MVKKSAKFGEARFGMSNFGINYNPKMLPAQFGKAKFGYSRFGIKIPNWEKMKKQLEKSSQS